MEDNMTPITSITAPIMLFGVIIAGAFLNEFIFIPVIVWAVCIAVLFLCECLFKRKNRTRFSTNIGAFIAAAVMGAVFTVWVLIKAPFALSELEWWLACMSILPPMIVSLLVNIGNVIYKVRSGKAAKPGNQQPRHEQESIMAENYEICVAKVTGVILFFGLVCTIGIFAWFGLGIYLIWAVCVGVLFLCEYLFKRKSRKLFTTNIGAFIAIALMTALFVILLIQNPPQRTFMGTNTIGRDLTLIACLPPIIVSLIVNVCNIIYKVTCEKADRPNDPQP